MTNEDRGKNTGRSMDSVNIVYMDPNETGYSKIIVKGQEKTCIENVVKKKEGKFK